MTPIIRAAKAKAEELIVIGARWKRRARPPVLVELYVYGEWVL